MLNLESRRSESLCMLQLIQVLILAEIMTKIPTILYSTINGLFRKCSVSSPILPHCFNKFNNSLLGLICNHFGRKWEGTKSLAP